MSGVAFSLGKSKKKKKTAPIIASEFDSTDAETKQKNNNDKPPTLVIPLPKSNNSNQDGPLLARTKKSVFKNDNANDNSNKDSSSESNQAAAEALVREAEQHFAQKETTTEGTTDFSASGSLIIESKSNTFENETDQFRKDLESRAEDISVESNVYDNVRIVDFGAAMLRGMGWKGDNNNNNNNKDADMSMPRPHRLGLGATPKLPTTNTSNKLRRPDQVKRDEMRAQQHEEYRAKREEQQKLDKQITLQIGSVVECNGRRAKMIQLQGVPGLNQVRVQYEGEAQAVSVKKSFINLIDRDELNAKPFHEVPLKPKKSRDNERREKDRDSRSREKDDSRDGHRDKRDRDDRRSRDSDRHSRDNSDSDRKDERRSKKRRSRSRERESSSRDKKRRKEEKAPKRDSSSRHWLIPNIRVRVVSKKFGSRLYKQKGVVLDVMPGGGAATLKMENGQVLEHVSERHLETALPKPGGNAVCLVGKHKLTKGKLLERDSSRGVIQVFEDMSVLTLALDDVAQWCGPLDDDLEL